MTSDQDSRRKRNRCLLCIAAGIIAQTIIIVLFVVFVLRVKTPKVRLDSLSVDSLTDSSNSSSPSFKIQLNALVTVKNNNFGHYKYEASKASFSYKGTEVGESPIAKDKAKAKKTKKINVVVSLDSSKVSSSSHSQLSSDLSSGNLTLTAYGKLDGKVHLLNIIKKKKSANLNCTIHVDTKAKMAHVVSCN